MVGGDVERVEAARGQGGDRRLQGIGGGADPIDRGIARLDLGTGVPCASGRSRASVSCRQIGAMPRIRAEA